MVVFPVRASSLIGFGGALGSTWRRRSVCRLPLAFAGRTRFHAVPAEPNPGLGVERQRPNQLASGSDRSGLRRYAAMAVW